MTYRDDDLLPNRAGDAERRLRAATAGVPWPKPKPKVKTRVSLKHGKPLQHGAPMKRSGIKARGKRTKKSKGHLFPANVDEAYREFIRGRQCLIAGRAPRWVSLHNRCQGVTQVAHVKSRGAGGADHANLLPLCAGHHYEQHAIGKLSFEARYTLSLRDEAELLWKLYGELGGAAPSPDPKEPE